MLLRAAGSGGAHTSYTTTIYRRCVPAVRACGSCLRRLQVTAVHQEAAAARPGCQPASAQDLCGMYQRRCTNPSINANKKLIYYTQIDLTDDYVVMALFGDGSWEEQVRSRPEAAVNCSSTHVGARRHLTAAAPDSLTPHSRPPASHAHTQMQRLQACAVENGSGSPVLFHTHANPSHPPTDAAAAGARKRGRQRRSRQRVDGPGGLQGHHQRHGRRIACE